MNMEVNIDEELLTKIAEGAGASITRLDQDLPADLRRDRSSEKTEADCRKYQQFQEVYGWFAVPALVLLLLELVLAHTVWRKLP